MYAIPQRSLAAVIAFSAYRLQCFDTVGWAAGRASGFSKIQIGFAFLVLAYPGSPGQRAVQRVCVCVSLAAVLLLNPASVLFEATE